MPFEAYFNEFSYNNSKGKGISIFRASVDLFNAFCDILREYQPSMKRIILSDSNDQLIENLVNEAPEYIVLYQDLPIDEFKSRADFLLNHFIWPVFYRNIPCSIFDINQRISYFCPIQSGIIHSNKTEVINHLLLEQYVYLSDLINIQLPPNGLNEINSQNLLTPIEQIMKDGLIAANLSFQTQVRINNFIVDFLVSREQKSVIVECDGRDFHNPHRDMVRDQQLAAMGFKLARFTGSEIFADINSCVDRIFKILENTQTEPNYLIDANLDESQQNALGEVTGPIRVLAPAGSGKTKTLINRIASLIDKGIKPHRILALAFNTKAANEMRARLITKGILCANNLHSDGVAIRTFHSFGYEIIREYLHWNYNENNAYQMPRGFLIQILNDLRIYAPFNNIPQFRIRDAIDKCLDAMCRTKMELLPVADVTFEIENTIFPFEEIFNRYLTLQTENELVTFDDMIYLAVRELLDNQAVRRALQNRFEYILIDEFQDLNDMQLLLMQLIALPKNNLFIVGDDDQMIYGWRGANVRHIIDFKKRYSIFSDHTLSTNYRSSVKIVRHSSWLIEHNHNRVRKDIRPRQNANLGQFNIEVCDSLYAQSITSKEWLLKLHEEGAEWSDFAILYRYNDYQYAIALALDAAQIPHTPVNGLKLFSSNPGRDIYAYLTVILHPLDATHQDFSRILKRPNNYINNEIINQITDWQSFLNLPDHYQEQWRKEKAQAILNNILSCQDYLETHSPEEVIANIFETFRLREFYHDVHRTDVDLDQAPDEVLIDLIISVATFYNSIDEFYMQLHDAVHNNNPINIENNEENEPWVALSSIHSAKGKEFKYVIYFNHIKSQFELMETDIEEERRVSYVGITRAIDSILITTDRHDYSPFVKEAALNPEYSDTNINQINEKLSGLRTQLEREYSEKNKLEEEREALVTAYPELNGAALKLDISNHLLPLNNRILVLKGMLQQDIPVYSGLFSRIRQKYMELDNIRTSKRIDRLRQKIEKLEERARTKRTDNLAIARERMERIDNLSLPSIRSAIFQNKRLIDELETEVTFRKLLQ